MKKLMFIAMLLLSTFASAGDYLYLGAWSHHFNDHPDSGMKVIEPDKSHPCWRQNACVTGTKYVEAEYNETHNLIGYQTHGYMFGYFKNSFDKSSVVIAKNFEYRYKDAALILSAGATHGYGDCRNEESEGDARLCPHIQVGIAYTKFKIEPVLSATDKSVNLSFRIKI